jgi:hypothetical protein
LLGPGGVLFQAVINLVKLFDVIHFRFGQIIQNMANALVFGLLGGLEVKLAAVHLHLDGVFQGLEQIFLHLGHVRDLPSSR